MKLGLWHRTTQVLVSPGLRRDLPLTFTTSNMKNKFNPLIGFAIQGAYWQQNSTDGIILMTTAIRAYALLECWSSLLRKHLDNAKYMSSRSGLSS